MNQIIFLRSYQTQCFAFRVFSLYLIFYFLFMSDFIGNSFYEFAVLKDTNKPFQYVTVTLVSWINNLFLHKQFPGAVYIGDNYWTFTAALLFLIIAIISASIWTIIDKGKSFPSFYKYMHAFARYYLGFVLLLYGLEKITFNQFGIQPSALAESMGNNDSWHLFRVFMGISKSYKFFSGLIELIPGLLLLFRRTSTLGSLIALPVFINVMMLNIGYDIWLKLLIFHLILFSIFILLPDLKKMVQIFILKQNTSLTSIPSLIENKNLKWLQYALKFSLIGIVIYMLIKLEIRASNEHINSPYSDIVGIHEINRFSFNLKIPQSNNDSANWKKVTINTAPFLRVQLNNDSIVEYNFKVDTSKRLLELNLWNDTSVNGKLHYTSVKPKEWLFEGKIKSDSIRFTTRKIDMYDLPLLKGYGKVKWVY